MTEATLREIKLALRTWARQPVTALLAASTLAMGVGAATAVFAVVGAVRVTALPYPDNDRLVQLFEHVVDDEARRWGTSYRGYQDWVEGTSSLEEIGVGTPYNAVVLSGESEPVRIWANYASPSYLRLLGAETVRGRSFGDYDDRLPGGHPVAIISHHLWQEQLGGAEDVIGRDVTIANHRYEVVGVMDPGFVDLNSGVFRIDVWIPFMMIEHVFPPDALESRMRRGLTTLGRLREGRSLANLNDELQAVALHLAESLPDSHRSVRATADTLHEVQLGLLQAPVRALMAGAFFLLLVAGLNVAGLLVVRSVERRRQLAVRAALGASRGLIVRQLVVESLLLAGASVAVGVALAAATLRLLPTVSVLQLPTFIAMRLDLEALLFAAAVALLFGLLAGVVSAAVAFGGGGLDQALRGSDRGSVGRGSAGWVRDGLVVLEVAMAVVLVIGSGLLIRSLQALRSTDLGYSTASHLSLQISLPTARYPESADAHRAAEQLRERLAALPGVDRVAVLSPNVPGQPGSLTTFVAEGHDVPSQLDAELGRFHQVSPGAIEILGIPLLEGRTLEARDRTESLPVVVVSESLSTTLWPGERALGKRLRNWIPFGADPEDFPFYTVVGVVADSHLGGRTGTGIPTPHDAFFAHAQRSHVSTNQLALVLQSSVEPTTLAGVLPRAVHEVDPELPIFNVQTLAEIAAQEEELPRFTTRLMGAFGALSLFLASLGIYGVLAQAVAARRSEIGLRAALGAPPFSLVRLFVGHGLRLSLLGVGIGLVAALGLGRFVSSLLFGVTATDPLTLVTTVLVLLGAALLAAYLPTRRALRIDPKVALQTS